MRNVFAKGGSSPSWSFNGGNLTSTIGRLKEICVVAIAGVGFPLAVSATETTLDHLKPISASQGVAAFQKFCSETGGKAGKVKRALKSDPAYTFGEDPDAKVLALHNRDAIQVLVNRANACSVLFLTISDSAEAVEQATVQLKQAGIISGSGKKMLRFRTDYRTPQGTVIVLNHEVIGVKGMEVALMK